MPSMRDLTARELEVHTLYNVKKMNQYEIAEQIGISQQRIAQILKNIVKKGCFSKDFKQNKVVMPVISPLN